MRFDDYVTCYSGTPCARSSEQRCEVHHMLQPWRHQECNRGCQHRETRQVRNGVERVSARSRGPAEPQPSNHIAGEKSMPNIVDRDLTLTPAGGNVIINVKYNALFNATERRWVELGLVVFQERIQIIRAAPPGS